jgi:predicted transposase/invertase (TIGR01784 family)
MKNITPISDIFIKYLFDQEPELLLSFINAVLSDSGFKLIKKVQVKNPFNYKEYFLDKETILDIKAEDEEGNLYDIEVQAAGDETFAQRSLYYWAKYYTSQLKETQDFDKLLPTICINLLNFKLIKTSKPIHHCFLIKEQKNPELVLTEHLILHFIELPKFDLAQFNIESSLERWLYFFKQKGGKTMEVVITKDKFIKQAEAKLEEFKKDEKLQAMLISKDKWRRDQIHNLNVATRKAEQKGEKKGEKKGKIEGKIETAKKMQEEGFELSTIARITELSEAKLKQLLK